MADRQVHSGPQRSAEAQRTSPTTQGRAADSDAQREHHDEIVGTVDKPLVRDHTERQGVRQRVSRPGSVSPGATMSTTPEATGDVQDVQRF